MSTPNKRPARQGRTVQELEAHLLKIGKFTKEGLAEAQRELDNDPEWQAFLAAQPKREAA